VPISRSAKQFCHGEPAEMGLSRMPMARRHTPREQQDVALPLMIPFGMVMLDIFAQGSPQGALAKENHLGQALVCTENLVRID
jgi:hypothetical protein